MKCNLNSFFNDKSEGVNLNLKKIENFISLGIKKRIALAQIFYKDSEIIIFDDPTQGCDKKTCEVIYNFLNKKISENKIVIIFSNDPFIIKGAQVVIELKKGNKPIYLKK
jgi:ABC-type transport system involved in cytochrome bd biosynthesis fused ATPase/permease subunit